MSPRWSFCVAVVGKVLDEGDVAGRLVIGEALRAGARDIFRERARILRRLARHDQGEHFLAADFVRHRCDRDAGDASSVYQDALDLDHRDVLAGAAHDVLLAVDEEERTVVAFAHDVAGVEPAARPGLAVAASSFR